MNKLDFTEALALAKSGGADIADFDAMAIFDGFGMSDFKPVACTKAQLARLIRWQCFQFNGSIDADALNEIWKNRRKFIVVG